MKFIKDNIKLAFNHVCFLFKGDAKEALKHVYFHMSEKTTFEYRSRHIYYNITNSITLK